jgi:glycosyltransferase involved in cell wall biosynthesis
VIATDDALRPVVERHLGVDATRVRVIPNAIDIDACDRLADGASGRRLRAAHGIGQEELVLLSVGRLQANKGFHVLADALRRLAALTRPETGGASDARWRWVLVGEGPYRGAIDRAIDAAGLRSRVLLAGRASEADLHAWYEAATLFVHPTLFEGSSLVTLEAMAHRRAVVATAVGGIPDKVIHGRNGYLVAPGNSVELGDKVLAALRDAPRLRAMGEASYEIACRTFDWQQTIHQTLMLYERVTRRPTAQPHFVTIDSDSPVAS